MVSKGVGRGSTGPGADGREGRDAAHPHSWHDFAWPGEEGWLAAEYDKPQLRYLALNDPTRLQREAWAAVTFGEIEQFPYTDTGTSYLSVASRGFDGLLVGGNDVARLIKVVRRGGAMLTRRLKVALTTGANAHRRAQLISGGYDDVFDSEKTHPLEARARVMAIWRRYRMRFEQERIEQQNETMLARICNPYRLTERERKVLLLLLKSDQHFATYAQLKREITDYHEEISDRYLKVIVCLLRRKLIPGVRITARTRQGYSLHF